MSATRITNNQIATSTITATNIQSGTLVGSLFNPNLTLNSNVTIAGNLSVAGNTTTINATNTYINDPLVVFNNGYGGSLTGYDIGIIVNRNLASLGPYGSVNTAWVWVEADQAFEALATTSTGGNVQSINNSGFSNIKVGNATMSSVTISGAFNASGAITFTTATGGGLQAVAIGNVTPGTGFFTQIGSTTSANLNTVTAASVQGVIGNVTPAAATFTSVTANTESVGGLQAVAIGNVTPGTGVFTTGTFNTATTGGLQAVAIGNVTPGSGAFTSLTSSTTAALNTVTGASFQGVIGNVTPAAGTFTSLTATSLSLAAINGTVIGNVTPAAGTFTSMTAQTETVGGLQAVAIGNVTPGTAVFTTASTGGLQAVAIGNVTPGTGAFTTVTGGSFQGVIGNVTPTTAFFTTANATNLYAATIGNVGTTLNGTLAATNVSGTVATANVAYYDVITNLTNNQTYYVEFANVTSGNSITGAVSTITVNPSTGTLAASAFSGGTGSFTTLGASGIVTFTNATQNTGASTGALQVTGGAYIGGNLWVGGNLNLTTSTTINSPSGSFTGNAAGFGALYAGITAGYVYQPQTVIQASTNFNGYAQVNHQNINNGASASTDFVATMDTGTAGAGYIDMGINSSGFNGATNGATLSYAGDGYLYVQANATGSLGNLMLGTAGTTGNIFFVTGGQNTNNQVMTITTANTVVVTSSVAATNTSSGALQVQGGVGVAGAIYAGSIQNTPIGSSTASTGAFTSVTLTGGADNYGSTYAQGALQITGGAGISGNLYVQGNIYAGNLISTTTQILEVTDPLLYLNASNPGTYNYEIGFYSHFVGGGGNNYQHTALVRNHNDNYWYLVSNIVEPSGGTVNLTNANIVYDTLRLGTITLANIGNVINTSGSANIGSNVYAGNVNANQFYGTFNGTFSGSITGTPVAANVAYFLNEATTSTNATYYPLFGNASATGNTATFINTSYNFNPSTGNLTAGGFLGAVYATTIGATSTLNVAGASTLNTVTGASFQGVIGNVTPSTAAFTTATTGGLQATAIGNVTPGTGVFTTGTFNTATTGGLQATAIGNVTPGTAVFTTETVGGLQAVAIGNVTPGTGAFTTGTFNTVSTGGLQAVAIGNVTPGTGAFTTVTGGSFQGVIGNVTPTTAFFTTANATNVYAATIGNVGTTLNGTLAATGVSGTVATANTSIYAGVTNNTSNGTFYPMLSGQSTTGNAQAQVNGSLSYVPSSGALTATSFNGIGTFSTATTTSTFTASGAIQAFSGVSTTNNTTGALLVQGGAAITGNINIGGQMFVGSGAQATVLTGAIAVKRGTSTSGAGTQYTQDALINATNTGSSDFIAYGNNYPGPSNDHGWMDMGFTGDSFNDPVYSITKANDGYLFASAANNTVGGNLVLSTDYTGNYNDIVIGVGSFYSNSEVARFHGNTSNSGTFTLKLPTTNTLTANTGALQVWGGASVSGNVYYGASSTQVGGAVFNSGRASAGTTGATNTNALIMQGVNDSTLIYAKPLTAYDAVIIGGNAASTSFAQGAKFIVNSTDSMMLPVGTNAQRPGSSGGTDTTGMIRFNTTGGAIEWYNGTSWQTASTSFTVIADTQFTGTGSQTIFTLPSSQTTNSCIVSINGVVQIPTLAYSVSGTSLTFTEAPLTTDVIDVRMLTTTSTVTGLADISGYNQVIVSNVGVQFTTGTSSPTLQYSINTSGAIASTVPNVTISTSGTPTTVDSFFANTYSTAKYIVTSTLGTVKEATEILVISNGTVANVVTYGTINTAGNSLVSWSATMSGNIVQLQGTSTNNSTVVRMTKQYNAI